MKECLSPFAEAIAHGSDITAHAAATAGTTDGAHVGQECRAELGTSLAGDGTSAIGIPAQFEWIAGFAACIQQSWRRSTFAIATGASAPRQNSNRTEMV